MSNANDKALPRRDDNDTLRTNQRNANTNYESEQLRNETTERTQRDNDAPFNRPHTVRLAKHVTIPILS